MIEFVTNRDNLKESDVTEVVQRVKVLLINSKNEILLGYSDHEYQFPGGHVEENEDLIDTVNREIQEETGMELNVKDVKPFAVSLGYWKDWPSVGKNRKTEVYYYEVFTDELPNLNNTNYTKSEKENNFELRYIPLDRVEDELLENIKVYEDKHGIAREMLELFKIYKDMDSSLKLAKK